MLTCYLCNDETVITSYFCSDCNYIKRILQCYGRDQVKEIITKVCIRNKKQMSHNLLSYKEARIAALLDEVNRLKLENEKLTTFIFELCDKDCPDEYKRVVQSDVFQQG